ncbi:hypothetical protein NLG97_g4357 [Lecanicillium saksenae]|uniref:Uncharacterized protein n=1 Tax=Lecanicillium saksenae TaxID=468837 RepID=A0ACC1QYP3_9HYPO|nr:hypothetical protein NLG97_g4357 [Lecanicillium saksenae]
MSSNQTFDTSKLSTSSVQNTQLPQSQQRSKSPSPGGEPDATTYAPSQMREHLGPPEIAHDYPEDSTHRRHSSVSHQQAHYMR